jgi:glycerol kinase
MAEPRWLLAIDIGTASACAVPFEPRLDAAERDRLYAGWQDAVRRVRSA